MRIAFLTFEFPPTFGGGLSTYMVQTLRMLRTCGDQAFVLVTDNSVYGRKIEKFEGHDIIRVNIVNHPINGTLGYWAAASYVLAEALKDAITMFGMPDVVESCDGFGLAYYTLQRRAVLEAPFKDLKVTVTAHTPCSLIDVWDGKSWHVLPRYWVHESEVFCLKAADVVLAPSQFIIDELRKNFECADANFALVRNPYAPSPFPPQAPVPEQQYYVFGSRLAIWKGALDVVRAFDLYWRNGGTAHLRMFGSDTSEGGSGTRIAELIRSRYAMHIDAERLQIYGLVSQEELAAQKQGAIALLHPSHKENLPYTVIEHMAAGGMVIASANGGQAELITHGVNGLLFPAKDVAALYACLAQCETMEEAGRTAIGEAAKSVVRELCDYAAVYAGRLNAYADILAIVDNFPCIRGAQYRFEMPALSEGPRLSIVVPYFNLPEYVSETVHSALVSTFKDLEVIIVDDGSTDAKSPEILAKLGELPRVRILRQANTGVAAARNFGVMNARGIYVALLDADDVVLPTFYQRCIDILERYRNVGFVGCWNDDFNEQGTIRYWPTFNPEPPMQLIFNTTNCQGIVMRSEAYHLGGGHDAGLNMFLDDWEATISMLSHGVRGVMIPEPLFRYRVRQGSVYRSKADQWARNYEYILAKHAKFYSEYAVEIISFLNANGPNPNYHNPTWPGAYHGAVTGDPFAHGRLAQLVRGFYLFTRDNPVGYRIRRMLNFLSPLVNIVMSLAYRIRNRARR